MNGAFDLFKPAPVCHSRPSPEIAAKLAQLRAEALARSSAQIARAPDTFRPARVH
jgi:hypothetical protein